MTPDVWKNVVDILIEKYELSKNELFKKSWYVNKTQFWKYLDKWEKEDQIKVRRYGKELLVSLSSPEKPIREFINDFGNNLAINEKLLKKHLTALEKSLPLINPNNPMKPAKGFRRGVLELDKKDNVWRDLGKTEADDSLRTWNPRKKPLFHFEAIMNILNNLYNQSSVITFQSNIIPELDLMNKYQVKANKIIKDYIRELEDMFRGTSDIMYVTTRIRTVLYALVYRSTLEAKMKE
jgi:hypothetical protein